MTKIKKRNKKYNPDKADDIISVFEHQTGILRKQVDYLVDILTNNKVTIRDLLNEIQLLYIWCFVSNKMTPDIDVSEVLSWIENEFYKLNNINSTEECNAIKDRKIKVHYTKRDLLLAFTEHMYQLICSIRSRKQYAIILKDALVETNMRLGLIATHMRKFFNYEANNEAMKDCRRRIHKDEIARKVKLGYKASFNETGDIVYSK